MSHLLMQSYIIINFAEFQNDICEPNQYETYLLSMKPWAAEKKNALSSVAMPPTPGPGSQSKTTCPECHVSQLMIG